MRLKYKTEALEAERKEKEEREMEELVMEWGDLLASQVSDFKPYFEEAYKDEDGKAPKSQAEDMVVAQVDDEKDRRSIHVGGRKLCGESENELEKDRKGRRDCKDNDMDHSQNVVNDTDRNRKAHLSLGRKTPEKRKDKIFHLIKDADKKLGQGQLSKGEADALKLAAKTYLHKFFHKEKGDWVPNPSPDDPEYLQKKEENMAKKAAKMERKAAKKRGRERGQHTGMKDGDGVTVALETHEEETAEADPDEEDIYGEQVPITRKAQQVPHAQIPGPRIENRV
jgi:hypothetical protein